MKLFLSCVADLFNLLVLLNYKHLILELDKLKKKQLLAFLFEND